MSPPRRVMRPVSSLRGLELCSCMLRGLWPLPPFLVACTRSMLDPTTRPSFIKMFLFRMLLTL